MAQTAAAAATEPCPDPDEPGVVLQLERSSTAKSRYKGVTKVKGKTWQARVMDGGKLVHVSSSRKPRDCAIALAQFKRLRAVLEKPTLATAVAVMKAHPEMKEMFRRALIASGRCFGEEPEVRLMREQAALERGEAD